jgi:hypothetical protein
MSGQQPWQAPDGRWYSSEQGSPSWPPGRPEQPRKEKPEKESRLVAFREWLTTGTGIASLIVAIVGLSIGGAAASGNLFPSPKPTHSVTPSPPGPTPDSSPPTSSTPPVSLQNALISSGTVSSAAIVQSTGTDLSQLATVCGGPVSGDTATAYETIEDQQAGTYLSEVLVSWDSAADAGQAVTANRQAVDKSGSCSFTSNGATAQYTGDYAGSPPSSCANPGQYFDTQIEVTSPSSIFPYFGYVVIAQCGSTTIFIRVFSNQPGAITQQAATGYLSSAIGKLDQQR